MLHEKPLKNIYQLAKYSLYFLSAALPIFFKSATLKNYIKFIL